MGYEHKIQPVIHVNYYCDKCGNPLCHAVRVKGNNVFVKPCEQCLDAERRDGIEYGKKYNCAKEAEL